MTFPNALSVSQETLEEREKRRISLIRVSAFGILVRSIVITIELLGFLAFDSTALLIDALASLFDIASTLFLILSIRFASRPPDANHPLGHGRFEPLAGLQLAIMLTVLGGFLVAQQMGSLVAHETKPPIDHLAWIVPLIAVLLLEVGYRQMMHIARKSHSPALEADAWHYRIDALNSLLAMAVLALGALVPVWSTDLDFIGALLIALMMVGVGIHAAKGNLHQLLDRLPDQQFFDQVKASAMRVSGVMGTEKVRIQLYGPDAHVAIDVEVDPEMSVDRAHRISQKVRREIQNDWSAVRDVSVHIEPFYPNDH